MEIIRGDGYSRQVVLRTKSVADDGTIRYTPVDLTDCTLLFTAKTDLRLPDSKATLKANITTHTEPTEGKTVLAFTHSQTARLSQDVYQCNFRLMREGVPLSTKNVTLFIYDGATNRIS